MNVRRNRLWGLLIAAPALFGAEGGCGTNDKVVSMGGDQPKECARQDCQPALGMPNWQCADGGTGGPVCTRNAEGACAWLVNDCPPAPGVCDRIPQCEFACPAGMTNPVDDAGCTHTCECVRVQCSAQDCGPAPGMPNWQCPDGTTAGPSCSAGADGACAWRFIECPPDTDPCANLPQCDFACAPGMKNPVDQRGCEHTCECVPCSSDELARGECDVAGSCANRPCGSGCRTGTRVNAEACTRDGQCDEANFATCTCTSCKQCTVNGCADP